MAHIKIRIIDTTPHKNCRLCGWPLPKWWEDVSYWGKDAHRKQCRDCGKCLIGYGDFWGKCDACWEKKREKKREEKKRRKEDARIACEESDRAAKAEREYKIQQKELEIQQAKEAEINQYRQLRKDIETMPQYEHWRQAVFEKFGRKCAVCGSVENIEVDHRYKSFYAIVREYGITNTTQAYECAVLWNENNGAPLCKLHHDQTKSSMYRKQNNF